MAESPSSSPSTSPSGSPSTSPSGSPSTSPSGSPSPAPVSDTLVDVMDLFILGDQIVKSVPWEYGAVVADVVNTAQFFLTNLTSTVSGYCIGSFLTFTKGTLINQVRRISNYNGTSFVITVSSAFTATPTAADTFIIINQ